MQIFSQPSGRSFRRGFTRHNAGFTLVEMLVVMTIMLLITGALLLRQSRFDSSTILRSLAYGVALSVRQAQVYGTSVVGTSTTQVACGNGFYGNGNCYAPGYGLYFSAANPTSYILFADLDNNGQYSSNEQVKTYTFSKGYSLSDICAVESTTGYTDCWIGGTTAGLLTSAASLTVVFKRPNPDACFATNVQTNTCGTGGSPFYSAAYVQIVASSDPSNTKRVTITVPGEVSVCTTVGC